MISNSPENTRKIAKELAAELKNGGLVLLYGDLGSGKTTFSKGIAKALGIKEFSVKSPTYTYIRHQKNKSLNFYHIDLYRLETADELLQEEIMELSNRAQNLLIIEWADKLFLKFNKYIKVSFEYLDANKRKITVKKFQPKTISDTEIQKIYKRFFVPDHVIRHMRKVANLSEKLSETALKRGLRIQKNAVIEAALLHDVMRCVDIQDFKPENFQKNPSQKAEKCWQNLRKKYSKIGHEKAMADYLTKLGHKQIASLISRHGFFEVNNLKTLEEKILYYADKRVEKDRIVSLKKRLNRGKKRNIKPNDNQALIRKTEKAVFQLEAQLSKILGQNIDKL